MDIGNSTSVYLPDEQACVFKAERTARKNAVVFSRLWAFGSYLDRLPTQDERVQRGHTAAVQKFMKAAERDGREMPPPLAHPTDSGTIHMTWTARHHLLTVDVFADGSFEWFYKNRQTGQMDRKARGSNRAMMKNIAEELLKKLTPIEG